MLQTTTTHLRFYSVIFAVITIFFLASCTSQQQPPADVPTPPTTFNQNSWKTTISDTCQSFYDGCNNCMRGEDSETIACTRRYCHAYTEPTCLDDQ